MQKKENNSKKNLTDKLEQRKSVEGKQVDYEMLKFHFSEKLSSSWEHPTEDRGNMAQCNEKRK